MLEINKVYLMDYLDFFKKIDTNSVDLIITDPPYDFISKNPKGGGFIRKEKKIYVNNVNNSFGMSFNPEKFLKESKRVLKKMNMYIFTNKNLLKNYLDFIKENNYSFEVLLWLKPNPVPINNNHYLIDKEYIIFIREKGSFFNSTLGYENYFTYEVVSIGGKRIYNHPSVKPEKLIRKFLLVSSNENDLVLDCFLGSGTTTVVAKKYKRNFIGCDNNKEYVKMARKRLQQNVLSNY